MGMKKGQKQYGKAFTERILQLKVEGMTHRQISELLGVTKGVIKGCVKRYNSNQRKLQSGQLPKKAGKPRKYPITTVAQKDQRIKELEMQVELLKMPRGAKGVKMRKAHYRAIYALSGKYSITIMCRYLNIPRCSYYKWLHSGDNTKELTIASAIQLIQLRTKNTYGYRRFQIALDKEYGHINHKAVYRIMAKYNMLSVIRRRYIYKGSNTIHKYSNLFNRDFAPMGINQKWCIDISYIITKAGRLYLSAIKDCYDGSIVSYKYSTSMNNYLVTQTVKQAIAKEKVTDGLCLHSDQGFQYTSREYGTLLKGYNITPSISRAGTPLDNAPIESFFSILKSECIYLQKPQNIQEAKEMIDEYIDFYNNDRIQSKSKMSPLEMRKSYTSAS